MILGTVIALLVLPVALDLWLSGPEAAFRYSATDAFYYHTIARNWARTGIPTFDQTHATNGFHPLWQGTLALLYGVSHRLGMSELAYLRLSILTCLALTALGVALTGRAVCAARGRLSPLFGLLPTGAYALCLAPLWVLAVDVLHVVNPMEGPLPLYGTLWSFVNGMECSLALFAFGALALAVVRTRELSLAAAVRIGVLCALLTLARLDHALIAAAVAISIGWSAPVKSRAALATALLVPLLAYLALNACYAGGALPVSGGVKTSFPRPTLENLKDLGALLVRPALAARSLDRSFRLAQILLPAAAMLVFAASRFRRRSDPWQRFLLASGVGALALAGYNFWFVKPYGAGQWYFPVSTLLVTLVVMELVPSRVGIAPLAALSIAAFVFLHRRPEYHARHAEFYLSEAPSLKAHYGAAPPKVIELDDGIFAFATGFPAFSGFGLAIDAEAYAAWKRGELGKLAVDRGFDRAATVVYGNARVAKLHPEMTSEKASSFLHANLDQLGGLPEHEWAVDYLSPSRKIAVFRLVPKHDGTTDSKPALEHVWR